MNPTTWLRSREATHRPGQLRAGHEQMRGLRALLFAALAGSGASGVALGGEYGQLPDPETQTPEGWLQNCLIYATESVNAIGTFRVFPGLDDPATFRSDICSAEMVSIGGLSGALVPQGAPTLYDVALAAPTINLERLSRSSDCVFDEAIGSGLTIGDSPSIVPCEPDNRRNLDLSGMPADPAGLNAVIPFPTINPGTVDVVVPAGTTRELDPGAYGRITLEFNSTLVLKGPGNYEVRSIATIASSGGTRGEETRAYIEVESEGVSLMVKEYMALGHRSRVNVAGTRLFKIYVEGGDANAVDTWYSGNPSVTGFAFRGDGALKACWVYSPNATQMWRGQPNPQQTDYETQSFARAFEQQDGLAVIMTHPQDPGCYGDPVPDVICESKQLSDYSIDSADETVRATVTLRNLSSQPAPNVIVADSMATQLSFVAGSADYEGTTPSAVEGPSDTWTFDPLNVPSGPSELSYDIKVQGLDVDETACNTVRVGQGSDVSACQACVTRTEVVPPVPQCDYKDVNKPVIYQPTAVVNVAVSVSNPSPDSTTGPFDIVDTMGEKMEYVGNSATICNPDCVPIDPEDDPATNSWTFSGLTLAPNESLLLTYQAKVTNLAVDETVRNSVTLNPLSRARLFTAPDDEPGQCDASVTRRDEPQSIPAMGLLGVSFLTVAIAVIGARLGGRRRR